MAPLAPLLNGLEKMLEFAKNAATDLIERTNTESGYNKTLRDATRYVLLIHSFFMFMGLPKYALFMSLLGIVIMYHGRIDSYKNIAWGSLIWMSLPASVMATILRSIIYEIDRDRAYGLYIFIKLLCRSTEFGFSFFCGVLLLLTAIGKLWKSD